MACNKIYNKIHDTPRQAIAYGNVNSSYKRQHFRTNSPAEMLGKLYYCTPLKNAKKAEKYVENVPKFVLCRKIRRKYLDNTGKSEFPG